MNRTCDKKFYELWKDLYTCSTLTFGPLSQSLFCYGLVFENFGENYVNKDKTLKIVREMNNFLEILYNRLRYLIGNENKYKRLLGLFIYFPLYSFVLLPLSIVRDVTSGFYSIIKLHKYGKQ